MSRIRVDVLGEGQHPSERMIAVTTASGTRENVMVDRRSIRNNNEIEIGYPVASEGDRYLIELPRETTTGQWRVWVKQSDVFESEKLLA